MANNNNNGVFDPLAWASLNDNNPATQPTSNVAPDNHANTFTKSDDTETQVRDLSAIIVGRGIDITSGYSNWLNLGFALADGMGENGRSIFHDLSRMNSGYNSAECDKQYSACLRSNGSGVTIKSFFQMAKDAGVDISRKGHSSVSTVSPQWQNVAKKESDSGTSNSYIYDIENNITDTDTKSDTDSAISRQGGEMAKVAKSDDGALNGTNKLLPTFSDKINEDDLSPFMQKASSTQADYAAKDMIMLGTDFTLSSCMPNYYGVYDGKKVYTSSYLAVVGPAASGKGDIDVCRELVEPIENEIHQANEKEFEDYQKENAAWIALDKSAKAETLAPKEPPYRSLYISANSSNTAFCQALNDNHGCGLVFETEGNTMAGALKTEYGDYSDTLCKAFQHERINYSRRKENEHVKITCPRLAFVITMTPGQVPTLLPSYESGLGSRIPFYIVPRKLYWRNVFEVREKTNEEIFQDLGKLYLPVYHALQARKDKPIQFLLSPSQQREFNQFFEQLQYEQVCQFGDDLVAVVRRLGLICFRMMMVLSMLRRVDMTGKYSTPVFEEDEQAIVCDERDFRVAMTAINCLINHSAYVYTNLVPHVDAEANESLVQSLTGAKLRLYQALEINFTTKDVYKVADLSNVSHRTADRYLGDLIGKHHLVRRIKNGQYEKIVNTNESKEG